MPGPGPLPPPATNLHAVELPIIEISHPWYRSHLIDLKPVYYSKAVRHRFDDPKGEYGVLYLAQDAHGAFVETFGQLMAPVTFPRTITSGVLLSRALSQIVCKPPLRLVDLTGPGLARIGADSRLFAGEHEHARIWSRALFTHPAKIDGLLYPTRHDPVRKAAAIFNEGLSWADLSRGAWLGLGLQLRDILQTYGFALVESQIVPTLPRKGPQQEVLF